MMRPAPTTSAYTSPASTYQSACSSQPSSSQVQRPLSIRSPSSNSLDNQRGRRSRSEIPKPLSRPSNILPVPCSSSTSSPKVSSVVSSPIAVSPSTTAMNPSLRARRSPPSPPSRRTTLYTREKLRPSPDVKTELYNYDRMLDIDPRFREGYNWLQEEQYFSSSESSLSSVDESSESDEDDDLFSACECSSCSSRATSPSQSLSSSPSSTSSCHQLRSNSDSSIPGVRKPVFTRAPLFPIATRSRRRASLKGATRRLSGPLFPLTLEPRDELELLLLGSAASGSGKGLDLRGLFWDEDEFQRLTASANADAPKPKRLVTSSRKASNTSITSRVSSTSRCSSSTSILRASRRFASNSNKGRAAPLPCVPMPSVPVSEKEDPLRCDDDDKLIDMLAVNDKFNNVPEAQAPRRVSARTASASQLSSAASSSRFSSTSSILTRPISAIRSIVQRYASPARSTPSNSRSASPTPSITKTETRTVSPAPEKELTTFSISSSYDDAVLSSSSPRFASLPISSSPSIPSPPSATALVPRASIRARSGAKTLPKHSSLNSRSIYIESRVSFLLDDSDEEETSDSDIDEDAADMMSESSGEEDEDWSATKRRGRQFSRSVSTSKAATSAEIDTAWNAVASASSKSSTSPVHRIDSFDSSVPTTPSPRHNHPHRHPRRQVRTQVSLENPLFLRTLAIENSIATRYATPGPAPFAHPALLARVRQESECGLRERVLWRSEVSRTKKKGIQVDSLWNAGSRGDGTIREGDGARIVLQGMEMRVGSTLRRRLA